MTKIAAGGPDPVNIEKDQDLAVVIVVNVNAVVGAAEVAVEEVVAAVTEVVLAHQKVEDPADVSLLFIGMFPHQDLNTSHHFNIKLCKPLDKFLPI